MDNVNGTVSRVNGKGFQIQERDGWLNLSRFAPPEDVSMPPLGARVCCAVDGKGFVRKVEVVGQPPTADQAPAHAAAVDRDVHICRQACLNTAVAILGGGPGSAIDPAEAIKMAARLEAWVRRAPS